MALSSQPLLDGVTPLENDEQRLRYVQLNFRKLQGTRCVDWEFFENIGLKDRFWGILEKCGLLFLSQVKEDTYKHLTMEFMSSLSIERGPSGSTFSFRLKGRNYVLTSEQFGGLFEIPCSGRVSVGRGFPAQRVWSELIGENEEYFSKSAPAFKLRDPSIRMLHEFLAFSLNARTRHNFLVQVEDLFLLKCIKDGTPINAACYLMNRFDKISRKDTGAINIGGYITRLARCLNVELNEDDEAYRIPFSEKYNFIGTWALDEFKLVEKFGGRWGQIQEEQDPSLVATTSQDPLQVASSSQDLALVASTSQQRSPIRQKRARAENSQDAPGLEPSLNQTILQQLCENVQQLSANIQQLNDNVQQLHDKVQSLSLQVKSVEEKVDLVMLSSISEPSLQIGAPSMLSSIPPFPFNFLS